MSKSRKWAMGALVVASMAVVGVASALDEKIEAEMAVDIANAIKAAEAAPEDQKIAVIKAALASKENYNGKIDELIQALADAKISDAVATKVIYDAAPTMSKDLVANNFSAAQVVTQAKSDAGLNPVTAAGNGAAPVNVTQAPVTPAAPSAPVFSAPAAPIATAPGLAAAATAPSNAGTGTGVSRT